MKKCNFKSKEKVIKLACTMLIGVALVLNINNCYAVTEGNFTVKESMKNEFMQDIIENMDDKLVIKDIEIIESDINYMDKEIVETKILNQKTENYIYSQFGKTREYKDENYNGVLELDKYDIEIITNGFYEEIEEKVVEFNDFTDNDLNNIDKEIVIDNNKYFLINVEWNANETKHIDGQDIPVTYKGKEIYQRVKQVKNPDTYKVTVTYKGKVQLKDKFFNYNIKFDEKVEEEVKEEIKEEQTNNFIAPIIISGAGIAMVILYVYKQKKGKKQTSKNNKKID